MSRWSSGLILVEAFDARVDTSGGRTAGSKPGKDARLIVSAQILMTSRFHKSDRPASRAIAIFGAALILVSQAIGAAHFHEGAVSHNGVVSATLSADPGLCPICQLALHSPGSFAAATTVARGPDIIGTIFLSAPVRSASPVFSTARVRAPPVSL